MSALIQSSSGVTVITVGLVSARLLNLRQAIGIVMGANIGTLASIGSNIAAKCVAAAHVLLNVIETVLFMVLLLPFTSLMEWMQSSLDLTPAMTLAFAHGTFNITKTILLFPFIGTLAYNCDQTNSWTRRSSEIRSNLSRQNFVETSTSYRTRKC